MSTSKVFIERKFKSSAKQPILDLAIRVGIPVKTNSEWKCRYELTTSASNESDDAFGEDGLQALINAIEGARVLINKRFPRALWLSDDEGDICFPVIIPQFIPHKEFLNLRSAIQQLVDNFLLESPPQRLKRGDR